LIGLPFLIPHESTTSPFSTNPSTAPIAQNDNRITAWNKIRKRHNSSFKRQAQAPCVVVRGSPCATSASHTVFFFCNVKFRRSLRLGKFNITERESKRKRKKWERDPFGPTPLWFFSANHVLLSPTPVVLILFNLIHKKQNKKQFNSGQKCSRCRVNFFYYYLFNTIFWLFRILQYCLQCYGKIKYYPEIVRVIRTP